ncbi:hypothetical protein HPB47_004155, partial [Ixodes persulcatus]
IPHLEFSIYADGVAVWINTRLPGQQEETPQRACDNAACYAIRIAQQMKLLGLTLQNNGASDITVTTLCKQADQISRILVRPPRATITHGPFNTLEERVDLHRLAQQQRLTRSLQGRSMTRTIISWSDVEAPWCKQQMWLKGTTTRFPKGFFERKQVVLLRRIQFGREGTPCVRGARKSGPSPNYTISCGGARFWLVKAKIP